MKKNYVIILFFFSLSHLFADCPNGTILFKEDFGGNDSADLPIKATGIPQVIGYTYNANTAGDGRYSLRKQGQSHSVWIRMDDHTYPNDLTKGYLMEVDGSTDPSGQFYKTQIDNLCVGSTLYFSMWAASISPGYSEGNLSILIEDINGVELTRYNTNAIPTATNINDWKHFGTSFTITGSTPSVVFKIMNNNSNYSGNDFVLDDIEIRLCVPPVTVSVSPNDSVCVGDNIVLNANFTNDGTFTEPLVYKWLKSDTASYNSTDWTEIGIGTTYKINSVQISDEAYYKVAVASAGSIDSESCRAMSEPVKLSLKSAQDCVDYPDNIKQVDCYKTITDASVWGIKLFGSSNVKANEYYTPLVGDLNGDGVPEIVVTQNNWVNHNNGSLVVFSGDNISQSNVITLNTDMSYYSGAPYGLIRLADESNPTDIIGLIIVRTVLGIQSYKFQDINNVTEFKNYVGTVPAGPIAFADFNHDGKPEVYCGSMVFDAYSLNLIGKGNSNSGQGYFHSNKENISYAADVLPDVPGTELICGSVIYSVDVNSGTVDVVKNISPPSGFMSDGQTQVADFNADGLLDVLVKQNSTNFGIYAYDPRTSQILFSKNIATGTEQNFPMIGDIDADGQPEIVLLYKNTMKAYEFDGVFLSECWSLTVDDISGSTGMTLFDFNQDGLKEIVYRDASRLRIINGSKKSHITGIDTIVYNLSTFEITSSTVAEFPVVADCDGDGEAEIITTGTLSGDTQMKLHVFKSLNKGTWAPARPVWNQYAYNVTNVNKDLTIPKKIYNNAAFFSNGKQPFNNFQEQATTLNQNGDMVFEVFPDTTQIDTTIMYGQFYLLGGKTYTETTMDTLWLRNINNCDSVIILNLLVTPLCLEFSSFSDSICDGDFYFFNGKMLDARGVYSDTLQTEMGCDSIVSLFLSVFPRYKRYQFETIYQGNSYFINGHEYKKEGIYLDTLYTNKGCDSIIVTNLNIINSADCPDVVIPIYFTPDGDGLNEKWVIKNIECYKYHQVEIYDRFGKLLHKWENNFDAWDGYYLGKAMPSDDYWYIVGLNDRKWPVYVGHFSLIRR